MSYSLRITLFISLILLPRDSYLPRGSDSCGQRQQVVGLLPIGASQLLRRHSEWTIEDTRVSKEHFKIYTIIYEKKNPGEESKYQPFVYCEDLQSTNGTYVNHVLIGQICLEKIGYLLTDGDIIEIKPSWRFLFHQSVLDTPERNQHEVIDMHVRRLSPAMEVPCLP